MKYVQENLFEYEDAKFFNSLNEAEEEKEELSPAEKKAKKEELQKKGMAVVQKCLKNFDNFKKFAGDIWQEYRDFWATQKDADESVQQEGMFYNLWKSDYIVGVVKEPGGEAALKVFNTSAGDDDEYVAFESKNPDVINAFKDFLNGTVKFTMKDIIDRQKEAMAAKKKADEQRKKEEVHAKKEAKLSAFLGESAKKNAEKVEYGVFEKGGSIGGNKDNYYPGRGKLIKRFDTIEEAKEYAKKRRKSLTPGEKGYYKMSYITDKIPNKK